MMAYSSSCNKAILLPYKYADLVDVIVTASPPLTIQFTPPKRRQQPT